MARVYTANFDSVLNKHFDKWKTSMKDYIVKEVQSLVDDGPVLKKVTGRLWRWVKDLAAVHSDGFSIATQQHGKLWEEGWHRKEFDTVIRGKKVHVKAQYFPPRPFIKPTILGKEKYLGDNLVKEIEKAYKECFPDKTVVLDYTVRRG
jgi:hypothetical protein